MRSGFYKYADGALIRAGKFVHGPGFDLLAHEHHTYDLPIDGWYWFDSFDEAIAFFGVSPDVEFIE